MNASTTTTTAKRWNSIELLVCQRGFFTINALATQFRETVQTLWRDLAKITRAGRAARFHSGADLPSRVENIDYSTRNGVNLDSEKALRIS